MTPTPTTPTTLNNRRKIIRGLCALWIIVLAGLCSCSLPQARTQSTLGDASTDQSTAAIRELKATVDTALAEFERVQTAGGDILDNDPWVIAIVAAALLLSPYILGKIVWLILEGILKFSVQRAQAVTRKRKANRGTPNE